MTIETHSRDSAGDVVAELRPCPSCGSTPKVIRTPEPVAYAVEHGCDVICRTIYYIHEADAIAAWNKFCGPSREDVNELLAEIQRLRGILMSTTYSCCQLCDQPHNGDMVLLCLTCADRVGPSREDVERLVEAARRAERFINPDTTAPFGYTSRMMADELRSAMAPFTPAATGGAEATPTPHAEDER